MDLQNLIHTLVVFSSIAVVSSWPTDLGCYDAPSGDNSFLIELHTEISWDDSAVTIEKCITECRYRGFRLAAVRNGHECYCSNNFTTEASSETCTSECTGNKTQICGGPKAVNIFTVCKNGTYKGLWNHCDNICNCLVKDPPCDQITGKCSHEKCDRKCKFGFYGPTCHNKCGHCLGYCEDVNGLCLEGCQFGWKGDLCNEECDGKTFGFNCSQSCENCNGTCDHQTGECQAGCQQGYHGARCECQGRCDGINGTCDPDIDPVPVTENNSCKLILTIVIILGSMVVVLLGVLAIVTAMLISQNRKMKAPKSRKENFNPLYEDIDDKNGNNPKFYEEQPYATTSMANFNQDEKECYKVNAPTPNGSPKYSAEPKAERLIQPAIGSDSLEKKTNEISQMPATVNPEKKTKTSEYITILD